MDERLGPVHPGEVLREEYLKPMGLNEDDLAAALGLNPATVYALTHHKISITPDIALRLAEYFKTSTRLWLGLQSEYLSDIERAE